MTPASSFSGNRAWHALRARILFTGDRANVANRKADIDPAGLALPVIDREDAGDLDTS